MLKNLNSEPDPAVVAGMISVYEGLVRKFETSGMPRTYFRAGENIQAQMLWKKMSAILTYCEPRKIPPMHFLTAQFEMWRGGPDAGSYPSPRFIGVSDTCIKRFQQWRGKRRSLITATIETIDHTIHAVIDAVLRNRPGMTEEDFFQDPLLVRLLPPAARDHPLFKKAVEDGIYDEPTSQLMLAGYLKA